MTRDMPHVKQISAYSKKELNTIKRVLEQTQENRKDPLFQKALKEFIQRTT